VFGFGQPKCGKCGKAKFKLNEFLPDGSDFNLLAVQCSSCKTPAGVLDVTNVGRMLEIQRTRIAQLERTLADIQTHVHAISYVLDARNTAAKERP
jgi:hypothetical protein